MIIPPESPDIENACYRWSLSGNAAGRGLGYRAAASDAVPVACPREFRA